VRFTKNCPDIQYSRPDGKPLFLDASVPDGKGPFPTAILVHGGYFVRGDKTSKIDPLENLLSSAGFAWFSLDYRLAPEFPYPAAVEDVEAGVRWLRLHAEQFNVDVNRIVLIGDGAGGYMVAKAGADEGKALGIAAVVDFYGPNDLTVIPKHWSTPPEGIPQFFGVHDYSAKSLQILQDASPVSHVTKDMPPFLFIHGTDDQTVPFECSSNMCEAMKKAGARCAVVKVTGADHGMNIWEGKTQWESWKPVMIDWLNTTLGLKPKG
jgi:alpha-L-fucosidase 2